MFIAGESLKSLHRVMRRSEPLSFLRLAIVGKTLHS